MIKRKTFFEKAIVSGSFPDYGAEICPPCHPETMSDIWKTCICKPPEIPKEALPKCDFCDVFCGNDWCCMRVEERHSMKENK